ncbi:DUF1376 domain-containing protein [Acetobacter oeni]|uniref:DUF1376 domain-containing protein n=1 Tax=Acetobacter oeni TaxID=304077 RepID=A0A511XJP2_9PROT|nr:DUF1376 domain-containing protein [Acetobacter oeni]MBB3883385.1 hypothetical protein [Acetobacter oeni]NHO19364.1 DUF1376 domain-containing protein [Acetobacter oeni]GBR03919.1 hypothetical protein AA21952_1224 [Acetobacter oeni LMG 21952]GEN63167.1 hypothetical protein AOE01nite_13910 [Acetobacter oeni]
MIDLPDPMTPEDCDLRGLPYMPLDVIRIIDCDLFAISTGDEFKAAVALWCKSWVQIPAASLPDDDRVLAHLSGAGARWKKVRDMALRGWVKCSDGRLYHPTVSEKACHAWKARIAQRDRAAKRWNKKTTETGNANGVPEDMPDTCHGISRGNARERERERDIDKERTFASLTTSDEPPSPSAAGQQIELIPPKSRSEPVRPDEDAPLDARTSLFRHGLAVVSRLTGKSPVQSRPLIGKWLKTAKDDCALLNMILLEAADLRPAEPVAWIEATLRGRTGSRSIAVENAWAGVPDLEGV